MMRRFQAGLLLTFVVVASLTGMAQSSESNTLSGWCLDEKLERYFSQQEIRAKHIINNEIDPGPAKGGSERVELSGIVFEWITKPQGKKDLEITIKINGHAIELNNQKPANLADEDKVIGPEMLSTWDQVRLYEFGDGRKVITVTLRPGMCTGLMCGVAAQLYFDLKSKQTSFFGTYRTEGEAKLYSFGQDGSRVFVVATNFSGDPHGTVSESTVTYEPYRLEPNGRFVRENFFIKHVRQPEKSKKGDSVEDRWIERLRLDQ
jgi:hypothetical protein